ncbi:response regulator transcription factor [Nodosilinea sp. LEGE 07088]|uniref:response regulator transcription factor n=1 Tax=Nodosilinea sp. LEGE 07088 TaxID=2777968 RepID=UPI00187F3AEE|nr:response regulator transcription factor [Nodosilinea sp. LEGE 07088]MBE9136538.1 response regulator transcription factor [Nodosilinea sp. LEGE 07088]
MSQILIIEDNLRIIDFLESGLQAHGYTTIAVNTGQEALQVSQSEMFDLAILDLGLPDQDGLMILKALRGQGYALPIIVLTARDGIENTVAGLDVGADDYMTKPFSFEELLARIRVQLRNHLPRTQPDASLQVSDITMNLLTRQVWVGDRAIELSAREFFLVELFLRHPMQVLTREQILDRVWGYDYEPGTNIVNVYIGYLRKKLGNSRIETVRGIGYRLRA